MKYNPTKKAEFNLPSELEKVRAKLNAVTSEKRQKSTAAPDYRPFYGKVTETGFKLIPNTGRRDGYTPVMEGELTEVTESKPTGEEGAADIKRFTRMDMDMKLKPFAKFFSIFWLILCIALLGLALWLCFNRGFEHHWWMLLVGPGLLLIERVVCGIGFRVSASRAANNLKKLLK